MPLQTVQGSTPPRLGVQRLMLAAAFVACVSGTVDASTLRIGCDGPAKGAEVSVNGKFRGECPIDVQVPAGSFKITAQKTVSGKPERFEETVRLGDGVAKRIEVGFGDISAPLVPAVDVKAIAQQRYEAELAEYDRNIRACRPKHAAELRKLRQRAREDMAELFRECRSRERERDNKPDDWSWQGWYDTVCGVEDLDKREFWASNLTDGEKEFHRFPSDPDKWCGEQFVKPVQP